MECEQPIPDFLQNEIPEDGKIEFQDDTDDEDEADNGGGGAWGTGGGADAWGASAPVDDAWGANTGVAAAEDSSNWN
jgi:ATP-dependent RNA helicase DDX3X